MTEPTERQKRFDQPDVEIGITLIVLVPLFSPLAILGWQIYHYLQFGFWKPLAVLDGLRYVTEAKWLDAPQDWLGIHQILAWTPLTLAILVIAIFWAWIVISLVADARAEAARPKPPAQPIPAIAPKPPPEPWDRRDIIAFTVYAGYLLALSPLAVLILPVLSWRKARQLGQDRTSSLGDAVIGLGYGVIISLIAVLVILIAFAAIWRGI